MKLPSIKLAIPRIKSPPGRNLPWRKIGIVSGAILGATFLAFAVWWFLIRDTPIDTTSAEAYAESIAKAEKDLPEDRRAAFRTALLVIAYPAIVEHEGMAEAQKLGAPTHEHMVRIHGLTAPELISYAQSELDSIHTSRVNYVQQELTELQAKKAEYDKARADIGDTNVVGVPRVSGASDGIFSTLAIEIDMHNGGKKPIKSLIARWVVSDAGAEISSSTMEIYPSTELPPGGTALFRHETMGVEAMQVWDKGTPTSKMDVTVVAVTWADDTHSDLVEGSVLFPGDPNQILAEKSAELARVKASRIVL